MQNFRFSVSRYNTRSSAGYDEELRQYFLKIYSLISGAFAVSAFAVLTIHSLTHMMYQITPYGQIIGITGIGWFISFAPLGIYLFFAFGMYKIKTQTAQMLFWVYAVLMGMSLSSLGLLYTGESLVKTFFVCSATFGGMSLYGFTTKKDLTFMSSFLYMGLMGLIIASLVNLFMQSPDIEFALSFIFTGLIAFDTQKLKVLYFSGVRFQGFITKKNPTTLQITTSDNYYVNIPATYVDLVTNPSKEILDFRKSICPSFEARKEIFQKEVKKLLFINL